MGKRFEAFIQPLRGDEVSERDFRAFQMRAEFGPIVDKDAAMEGLGELRTLLPQVECKGKECSKRIARFEEKIFDGTAQEQQDAAERLKLTREGLSQAIQVTASINPISDSNF